MLLFTPAPALGRMSVVYDLRSTLQCLTGQLADGGLCPGIALDPGADGLFQQQNATAVIPDAFQAEKVTSSATPGSTSPSIEGLSARQMADVFRRQIDASGARVAFLDEIDGRYRQGTADAANLREAFTDHLSRWTDPATGTSYARRVHLYVRVPVAMFRNPAGWSDAWTALRLSGGVWVEAYTGRSPAQAWSHAETWHAWPRGFKREFLLSSTGSPVAGDPARLHLLLTSTAPVGLTQRRQWRLAATGASCGLLSNGPGAYRLGNGAPEGEEARAFGEEFQRTFGGPAVPGAPRTDSPWDVYPSTIVADPSARQSAPSTVLCLPAARLTPFTAPSSHALASVLTLQTDGDELPAALVGDSVPAEATAPVTVGRRSSVTVVLTGPGGIAERLGIDPVEFWSRGARLTASGAGVVETTVPVGPDGTAALSIEPTEPGAIRLTLHGLGEGVRYAAARPFGGTPPDIALSVACGSYHFGDMRTGELISRPDDPCVDALDLGRHGGTLTRILASPRTWSLSVPLRSPAGGTALLAVPAAPAPPTPSAVVPAPDAGALVPVLPRSAPADRAPSLRAGAKPPPVRLLRVVAPASARIDGRVAVVARFNRPLRGRVALERRVAARSQTLAWARARGRVVALGFRPRSAGRYRLRLTYPSPGARGSHRIAMTVR